MSHGKPESILALSGEPGVRPSPDWTPKRCASGSSQLPGEAKRTPSEPFFPAPFWPQPCQALSNDTQVFSPRQVACVLNSTNLTRRSSL